MPQFQLLPKSKRLPCLFIEAKKFESVAHPTQKKNLPNNIQSNDYL